MVSNCFRKLVVSSAEDLLDGDSSSDVNNGATTTPAHISASNRSGGQRARPLQLGIHRSLVAHPRATHSLPAAFIFLTVLCDVGT
jgi:hypothetical protein